MPSTIRIFPTAAMLWPQTQRVAIAGEVYLVLQLQVKDLARIEDEFARIAEPTRKRHADLFRLVNDKAEFAKLDRADRVKLGYEYSRLNQAWPPRVGNALFAEVMGTPEGVVTFLEVLLTRTNPGMTPEQVVDLAEDMDTSEWIAVQRIAWGVQDWEDSAGRSGRRGGEGYRWSEMAHALCRNSGLNYADIGEMFLSQLQNESNAGERKMVTLSD